MDRRAQGPAGRAPARARPRRRAEPHATTRSSQRSSRARVDIEAQNRHMIRGTFHGGDRTLAQSGGLRPAPGWAQHRMPIPGLYQTGGTTHPGRLDHRRARAQRGDGAAARSRTRPRGGGGRCPTPRVQAAIDHWAPRFTTQRRRLQRLPRHDRALERWDEWLPAWARHGDVHAELARGGGRGPRAHRRRGLRARRASPTTSRSSSGWSTPTRTARRRAARDRRARRRAPRCSTRPPSGSRSPLDGGRVVGNLRRPRRTSGRAAARACCIPGLDSTKEEFFHWEQVFLDRGLATLSLDGPGQGETGFELAHPARLRGRGRRAALDALPGRDDLDLDRIGVGGRLAGRLLRAARGRLETRIRAVAGISGPFNFGDCWDTMPRPDARDVMHHTGAAASRRRGRAAAELDLARRRRASTSRCSSSPASTTG